MGKLGGITQPAGCVDYPTIVAASELPSSNVIPAGRSPVLKDEQVLVIEQPL